MFNKLVKIVTSPIDAAEIALDYATGGDGSRRELRDVTPLPSDLRDRVLEGIDDE